VVELGHRSGLALEPGEAVGVGGYFQGKNLDRDVTVEALVVGAIDDAHAAGTNLLDDAVVTERTTDKVSHSPRPSSIHGSTPIAETVSAASAPTAEGRGSIDEWIAHRQASEPTEITIGGPKLAHTVVPAEGHDPGIVESSAGSTAFLSRN